MTKRHGLNITITVDADMEFERVEDIISSYLRNGTFRDSLSELGIDLHRVVEVTSISSNVLDRK